MMCELRIRGNITIEKVGVMRKSFEHSKGGNNLLDELTSHSLNSWGVFPSILDREFLIKDMTST